MQLTHEDAQRLIQLNLDRSLKPPELSMLSDHLRICAECRAYANEMEEVERVLVPVLQRQWNRQPLPLSVATLKERNLRPQAGSLLTTRSAAVGLVLVAFFFSAWQFVFIHPPASAQLPLSVPSVPTPSTASTLTTTTPDDCETIVYAVQGNETLADIARRFSVSEEEIASLNSFGIETISPSRELLIPACNFTPTGTVHPTTFTITFTPRNEPTTSTPGG